MQGFERQEALYRRLMLENQYTRREIVNRACSMETMEQNINLLEKNGIFLDAYERINRYEFPENEDIYRYAEKQESLGEIRSLYMAVKKGYRYFMSDDGDSRSLAANFFSSKNAVEVKTLYDVLIMCKEKGTGLTWKLINPTVMNAMNKRCPIKLQHMRKSKW